MGVLRLCGGRNRAGDRVQRGSKAARGSPHGGAAGSLRGSPFVNQYTRPLFFFCFLLPCAARSWLSRSVVALAPQTLFSRPVPKTDMDAQPKHNKEPIHVDNGDDDLDLAALKCVFAHRLDVVSTSLDVRLRVETPYTDRAEIQKVRLVRVHGTPSSAARPWRTKRPHWGVLVGNDLVDGAHFYHLAVTPLSGDADTGPTVAASTPITNTVWTCEAHAQPFGGEPFDGERLAGTTTLSAAQIQHICQHVVDLFCSGPGRLYTLYWHCGDFMRVLLGAVCDHTLNLPRFVALASASSSPSNTDAKDDAGPASTLDEDELRAGLFALASSERVCPKTAATVAAIDNLATERARSERYMVANLPPPLVPKRDKALTALSTSAARCILF